MTQSMSEEKKVRKMLEERDFSTFNNFTFKTQFFKPDNRIQTLRQNKSMLLIEMKGNRNVDCTGHCGWTQVSFIFVSICCTNCFVN